MSKTHPDIRIAEVLSGVSGESVQYDQLAPLVHVDEQGAQLAKVGMQEVVLFGAHFAERHHGRSDHDSGALGEELLNDRDELFFKFGVETVASKVTLALYYVLFDEKQYL